MKTPNDRATVDTVSRSAALPGADDLTPRAQAAPRILIVEDDYLAACEAEFSLMEADFEVTGVASSADEAVRLAKSKRPEVIVMDVRLIGARDGVDAALDIFRECGVRCIFATADGNPQVRLRASPAEPLGWLSKPYSPQALVETVRVALAELRKPA